MDDDDDDADDDDDDDDDDDVSQDEEPDSAAEVRCCVSATIQQNVDRFLLNAFEVSRINIFQKYLYLLLVGCVLVYSARRYF